ncbi:hypothetical protein KNU02_gp85 [Gordonia phage Pleakley]|uniref:Uncharacterized protein n=1 Tax=Gordonia phage Pleakley TaxID=2283246 RepID=A0A345M6K3_9CAUD|nr:hypothetical protein KNU02_gp85 [Gordonia phage Pleakley]AXH49810.1 hypothetical protein SEA_FURY_85 [Gordonia phage Fury]AXH66124.1 hypothetical protein SEA_PLEAKLEY_85 [Gordonia phage Pleakley]
MTNPQQTKHVNMMDKAGTIGMTDLKPAGPKKMGYIVREEPAASEPTQSVAIAACEIMGRDIGRFIRFVERFGGENESVRIVIGELRQIYMVGDGGDDITLSVGTCDPQEYRFRSNDMIIVYGDRVEKAPLSAEDEMLDERNNG